MANTGGDTDSIISCNINLLTILLKFVVINFFKFSLVIWFTLRSFIIYISLVNLQFTLSIFTFTFSTVHLDPFSEFRFRGTGFLSLPLLSYMFNPDFLPIPLQTCLLVRPGLLQNSGFASKVEIYVVKINQIHICLLDSM